MKPHGERERVEKNINYIILMHNRTTLEILLLRHFSSHSSNALYNDLVHYRDVIVIVTVFFLPSPYVEVIFSDVKLKSLTHSIYFITLRRGHLHP